MGYLRLLPNLSSGSSIMEKYDNNNRCWLRRIKWSLGCPAGDSPKICLAHIQNFFMHYYILVQVLRPAFFFENRSFSRDKDSKWECALSPSPEVHMIIMLSMKILLAERQNCSHNNAITILIQFAPEKYADTFYDLLSKILCLSVIIY